MRFQKQRKNDGFVLVTIDQLDDLGLQRVGYEAKEVADGTRVFTHREAWLKLTDEEFENLMEVINL